MYRTDSPAFPVSVLIVVAVMTAVFVAPPLLAQDDAGRGKLETWSASLHARLMKQTAFSAELDALTVFPGDGGEGEHRSLGTVEWWRCGRLVKTRAETREEGRLMVDGKPVIRTGSTLAVGDGRYLWVQSTRDGMRRCMKDVAPEVPEKGFLFEALARFEVERLADEDHEGRKAEVYVGREANGTPRVQVWFDVEKGVLVRRDDMDAEGKFTKRFALAKLKTVEKPDHTRFAYEVPARTELVDLTAPRAATPATATAKAGAAPAPAKKPVAKPAPKSGAASKTVAGLGGRPKAGSGPAPKPAPRPKVSGEGLGIN
ncbi:MAG: hypothetical protein R3F20_07330 [Planctomycetota bacterium]